MQSEDLDLDDLQVEQLSVSHIRKHPHSDEPATSNGGPLAADDDADDGSRTRAKRARTSATDIAVDGPDATMDSGSNDGDDSDSSDDFVDPSLKQNTKPRASSHPRTLQSTPAPAPAPVVLRSPPPAFAHNTGAFLPLVPPGSSGGTGVNMTAVDYTHISQALAHQPLATNPSQQTVELMQRLGAVSSVEGTTEERLVAFMDEIKSQMFNLSQRVDVVETSRFASSASISSLQSSLTALDTRLSVIAPPTSAPHPTSSLAASSLQSTLDALAASASANPVSDAANVSSAQALGALVQSQITELVSAGGGGASQLPAELKAFLSTNPAFGGSAPGDLLSTPVASGKAKRGKKSGTGGTAAKKRAAAAAPVMDAEHDGEGNGLELGDGGTPGMGMGGGSGVDGEGKPAKRARKPELSRVVRGTMFKFLGLALANNATKYHGYTSSPVLPEFQPSVQFDPASGLRLWRWEWEKTIRQSAANGAFANAIQNHVLSERAMGLHKDVPEADWAGLEDAVDSAYTNLRRERESQVDPHKKAKKDAHRKRGKKRGLKEEKNRRRTRAFKELLEGLAAPPETLASFVEGSALPEEMEAALDLRYMSSEEEVEHPQLLHVAELEILPGASTTLVAGEKTFAVHRQSWRSDKLAATLAELDMLKPPERAYRRIVGAVRNEYPPEGTPDWMINGEWKQKVEDRPPPEIKVGPSTKAKGKAKMVLE